MAELLSVDDAAARFGISRTAIFKLIKSGQLTRFRTIGDRKTYLRTAEMSALLKPKADPGGQRKGRS